jgi:nicotinamidase/pyrazinamidase
MPKALVVVDVQNDFISGTLPVPSAPHVVRGIAKLLIETQARNQAAIQAGVDLDGGDDYTYILATQDWHAPQGPVDHFKKWPAHCVANTWGAELDATLPRVFYTTFHKGMEEEGYSGMGAEENEYGGTLTKWLTGFNVKHIDIVGLALDHCVMATAIEAFKLGFEVRVILPLTAAVNADKVAQTVEILEFAGVEVVRTVSV